MTYEKTYEEALERAKKIYNRGYYIIGDLERIFPELKESEDECIEKIKKDIISYLNNRKIDSIPESNATEKWIDWIKKQKPIINKEDEEVRQYLIRTMKQNDINVPMVQKALAWLEKQGEQKEINLIEILKHYPRETELYSPLYGKLWLAKVDEKNEIITCYKYPLNKGCTRAILEQEETVSFYSNGTTGLPDFNISKDCMLFLYDIEKQGEKNPTDKVEPKFQEGDWVVNKLGGIWHIDSSNNKNYKVTDINGNHKCFPIDIQDRMRLWTIQDAKDGDVLATSAGAFIYNGNDGGGSCPGSHCGISTLGRFKTGAEYHWTGKPVFPATKEQRDLLFQKMIETGYEWDAEKKELKIDYPDNLPKDNWELIHGFVKKFGRIPKDVDELNVLVEYVLKRQKPTEWSEEDECCMTECINAIATKDGWSFEEKRKAKHWLESLKQRI